MTPNTASKSYGDADPAFTGTLTGFLAADGVTATYSRTPGETVAGSPYTISATLSPAGVLSNYSITYNTANFTIDPKAASVTPNAASKTYGGADPVLTGTLTGFLVADGVTATYSRTAGETVAGSPDTISAILSPAGVLSNYSVTYNIANFTIIPKAASVSPNAASKTYGNADPAVTGTLTGFLAGDGVTATYSRTAGETVAGSPYTISATLSPAGVLGNYTITYNTAQFTINPRALDITANNQSKTYGNLFTFSGTEFTTGAGQLVTGDSVTSVSLTSVSAAVTATVTAPGPTYAIVPNAAVGAGLANYSITYHNGTLTVKTRQLDITANNRTKTYGATVTFAGTEFTTGAGQLVNGNTVTSVTLTTAGAGMTATVTAPGPDYSIVPTGAAGTGLGNYCISYFNGTLHINTATLTIMATNRTKTFGATYTADTTLPSVDFSVSGLVTSNGDTVTSITLMCPGYAAAALPGPYTVTPSAAVGTGLGNYTIGYTNGQLTIGYGTCSGSDPGEVILPPINSDGSSVYKRKGGSTIPVKFKVCEANGNSISDPNVVFQTGCCGSVNMTSRMRGTVESVNEAGETSIPDVAFRYTGDHWQFNMDSGNLDAGYTYTFVITLKYGSIQFMIATK